MRTPGISETRAAMTIAATAAVAAEREAHSRGVGRVAGEEVRPDDEASLTNSSSADRAAVTISTWCDTRVPRRGINTRLKASEPTIAPTVFAAYTRPTRRPESQSGRATD